MAEIYGKVVAKENKKLWVMLDQNTPDFFLDNAMALNNKSIAILVDDGIETTPSQRKFAYAVMREILDAGIDGYNPRDFGGWLLNVDTVKAHFKELFAIRYGKTFTFKIGESYKQDAEHFIELLMEFVDEHDIMIKNYQPLDYLSDQGRYSHCYRSLMKSKCAVCGRQGDLHHIENSRIGIGGDRKKVNHIGRFAVELCRKHHGEAHGNEKETFDKYHLIPVKIDELIAAKHGLNNTGGNDDRNRDNNLYK